MFVIVNYKNVLITFNSATLNLKRDLYCFLYNNTF